MVTRVAVRAGEAKITVGLDQLNRRGRDTRDTDLATTGPDGTDTLKSDVLRKPPIGSTFTFVVDDVAKEDHTYSIGENKETQDSISP